MMVEVLKQAGTTHSASEVLKMSVNTGDSWSAQYLSVEGETASGPAALRGFCLFKSLLTSLLWCDGGERAVWDNSVGEGGVFVQAGKSRCDSCGGDRVRTGPLSVESTVEVIQIICQSKVFHRVGGFGFAACDHLKAFPD